MALGLELQQARDSDPISPFHVSQHSKAPNICRDSSPLVLEAPSTSAKRLIAGQTSEWISLPCKQGLHLPPEERSAFPTPHSPHILSDDTGNASATELLGSRQSGGLSRFEMPGTQQRDKSERGLSNHSLKAQMNNRLTRTIDASSRSFWERFRVVFTSNLTEVENLLCTFRVFGCGAFVQIPKRHAPSPGWGERSVQTPRIAPCLPITSDSSRPPYAYILEDTCLNP